MACRKRSPVLLRLLLLALTTLSFCAAPVRSLRFDLQPGDFKCINEDIELHAMAVGKYSVVHPTESASLPASHRITVGVTSPQGNSIHSADEVESGNFAFTSNEDGEYMACFVASDDNLQTPITIEFDWRTGVAAKDWTNIVKRGHVDMMKMELERLEETTKGIHEQILYLRKRGEEAENMNRTTESRMFLLSFLSLAVCLSVAGLQLWHLKTFFEKKKLL